MLNEKIEARRQGVDARGFGLFATAPLAAGEWVWRKDPGEPNYTSAEIRAWSAEKRENFFRNAYQTGPDTWHGPVTGAVIDPADYMNHGCDPNVWFESDDEIVARRAVAAGEEILYDYATSEGDADYRLECRCGSPLCRGTVRGGEMRTNQELRARYGKHVMSYLRSSS